MVAETFLKNEIAYKQKIQKVAIWDSYSWVQLSFYDRDINNSECYIGDDYNCSINRTNILCAIRVGAEGTKRTYLCKDICTVYRLDNNEGIEL